VASCRNQLAGPTGETLTALATLWRQIARRQRHRRAGERWAAEHVRMREAARARRAQRATAAAAKPWLSACVEQLRDRGHDHRHGAGFDATQFAFTTPGSCFDAPASGVLGWGIGAPRREAGGADRRRSRVGDSSYMFGAPTAVHWGAPHELPVLFTSGTPQWGAGRATRGVYPDGWAVETNLPLQRPLTQPRLRACLSAAGGYGERVEGPKVPAA
jgi:hypothetical protein